MNDQPEPKHRSCSQFTEYLDCQEKYRLKRIVRVPEVPSIWLDAGTAFHEATELHDRNLLEAGEEAPAEFYMQHFAEVFESKIAETETLTGVSRSEFMTASVPGGSGEKEDFDWWLAEGQRQVEAYIEWLHESEYSLMFVGDQPGIELGFDMDLGGVLVRGYIDRVYRDAEGYPIVVDIKSGRRQPNALQLGLYACALTEHFGLTTKRGAFYMSRKDKLSAPKWLGFLANKSVLTRAFQHMDVSERSGIYIPNLSGDCVRCFVKDHCPYFRQEMGEVA